MLIRRIFFLSILLISCATTPKTVSLDEGIKTMGVQIAQSMKQGEISSIAILDFSTLDGEVDQFGRYLSEGLIYHVFQVPNITVVERNQLSSVLKELQLQNSGLIDSSSMKELGKMLGVDALLLGSITDLGVSVEVNGRIVNTETTSIVAVTSIEILKDGKLASLQQSVETSPREEKPEKAPPPPPDPSADRVFFRSSGIEFWSTEGDFSKLLSHHHNGSPNSQSRNLASLIPMDDSGDELVFNLHKLAFDLDSRTDRIIDVIKVDLGGGEYSIGSLSSELVSSFNATCLILIDEAYLDELIYVSEEDWKLLGNGMELDFPHIVKQFIRDNMDFLDANGSILMPFSPIALSKGAERILFELHWGDVNDVYTMSVSAEKEQS